MNHLVNMIEQVKKIKNGIGVQNLLDAAYKILGNPIMMYNTEYKLQAYTDVASDDPVWKEMIKNGTFSIETRKIFDEEGFIEDVANSKIVMLKGKILKYDRISAKLFNKNNSHVANLVIVGSNNPFGENDLAVFDMICKIVSREISRMEFYQQYEQAHQETTIRSLINGSFDRKLDLGQMEILYDSLGPTLYIAVADVSLCSSGDAVYFLNLLKQAKPAYKYAVYDDKIVIIISTNCEELNVSKELNVLINMFEQHDIYAGISAKFENLFELSKYYNEALQSLNYVLECRCSQRIFPYDPCSLETMKQIKKLKNGIGVQRFLDLGAKIFGNPLLFHDMELNLLAYSKDVKIADPIWQELITYGTSSDETIELFKTENFVAIMDNTKSGALLVSEKIKYDRISWRIYNADDVRIGCTSIVNTLKTFSEDELVLFGIFSIKFCKEVGKIEFYNDYGKVYSETIINRLLGGKTDDASYYSFDVRNLYHNLMDNLYLAVIDTSQSNSKNINITYLRNLFNWACTVNRYSIYSQHIIVLVSIQNETFFESRQLDEISKIFEQNNIYAAISSLFENIYDIQKHYVNAVKTLNKGMKENCGKQWIFMCNESES